MSTSSTTSPGTGDGSTVPPPVIPAHPIDPAAACSCDLGTETGPAGDIVVLRVSGEIDMLTLPPVATALTAALERASADLVVDVAGIGFCCVRGFALLADTAHAADHRGINVAVSGLHPHLARIATLLWPEQHLLRYRSVAAAVTAIRIDHTYRLRQPTPLHRTQERAGGWAPRVRG